MILKKRWFNLQCQHDVSYHLAFCTSTPTKKINPQLQGWSNSGVLTYLVLYRLASKIMHTLARSKSTHSTLVHMYTHTHTHIWYNNFSILNSFLWRPFGRIWSKVCQLSVIPLNLEGNDAKVGRRNDIAA